MSVVRRGLPSSWPLLLGGHALRTPAKGVREAKGLDRFSILCSKVVFVESLAFSLDRRSPRAKLEKAMLNLVPVTSYE
jgi:hypothetical protein